jgi:hypothetical protein
MKQTIIPPPRAPYVPPITVMIDATDVAKVIRLDARAFPMPRAEVARGISGLVRQWVKENAA